MLGHRGCRLGITYPEITEMQARAIFEAAVRATRRGIDVRPEIMIPLVADVTRVRASARDRARGRATTGHGRHGRGRRRTSIGTMIELPRAALTADEIAQRGRVLLVRHQRPHADDVRAVSRDDAGRFLPHVRRDAASSRTTPSRSSTSRGRQADHAAPCVDGRCDAADAQGRHLRRARRRAAVGALLPPQRARLRLVLAVPRAGRAAGGGARRATGRAGARAGGGAQHASSGLSPYQLARRRWNARRAGSRCEPALRAWPCRADDGQWR